MEAACTAGEVVAIQGDSGELTIIQFEGSSSTVPVTIDTSCGLQSPSEVSAPPAVNHGNGNASAERSSEGLCSVVAQHTLVEGLKIEIKTEVSVQANDFEIEQATGILPARKRYIPFKYRDFRSADEIEEEDKEDSDYEPDQLPEFKKVKRGRGRPRKYPEVKADSGSSSDPKRPQMLRTPNGYKCVACSRVFTQKGNLKVHLLTHTDHRPWLCDLDKCDKAFRTKESLRRHKLSHMGIKPYECSECQKKFCSALSLQEHMSRHSDVRPYTCGDCQRSFRQVSCLRRHLLTHSSATPHACQVCGRQFSQAIYLRSHLKVHTGEKPFACDQCDKSFAHASDLTRHKIIHSDSKPYSCGVCSMRFNDPSSRRRHEREHTGSKPYACHLCPEGFKRASQLRAHLFRRHGGLKEGVQFRILDGPQPSCFRIELHHQAAGGAGDVGGTSTATPTTTTAAATTTTTKVMDLSALDQKKIINLIHNLNRNMLVQEVEVGAGVSGGGGDKVVPSDDDGGGGEDPAGGGMMMKAVVDGSQIETTGAEQVIVPVDVATVAESVVEGGGGGGSVITIAEVDAHRIQELGSAYHILQGLGEAGDGGLGGQQIYEVHYHTEEDAQQQQHLPTATETSSSPDAVATALLSAAVASSTSTLPSTAQSPALESESTMTTADATTTASSATSLVSAADLTCASASPLSAEYVTTPDFGSQDYYDWLSGFTEVCKALPVPLEVDLFTRISQVTKTLSDFMASPSGVITDKENFKILMNISKELNQILNQHLACMFQNL